LTEAVKQALLFRRRFAACLDEVEEINGDENNFHQLSTREKYIILDAGEKTFVIFFIVVCCFDFLPLHISSLPVCLYHTIHT
jgi:hypothetical protein